VMLPHGGWCTEILERFAVEKSKRSGGRGSGRPRRMSLKTTLFRRNDGSAAFEIGQFQKQNALDVSVYQHVLLKISPPEVQFLLRRFPPPASRRPRPSA
ncbi:MAG: hypothetical protein KHZ29_11725, partial [Desulfovibrionaceae bacterium]|nr:hypothetical protein [Desulfovibrionaceae bacterium]